MHVLFVDYDPVWAMQHLDIQDNAHPVTYSHQSGRYDDGSSVVGGQSQHSGGPVNMMNNQWFDSDV